MQDRAGEEDSLNIMNCSAGSMLKLTTAQRRLVLLS